LKASSTPITAEPTEPRQRTQRLVKDGGGLPSTGDWSTPPPGKQDRPRDLRHGLREWVANKGIPHRLVAHCELKSSDPLFTETEENELHELTAAFCQRSGQPGRTGCTPGQPHALDFLEELARVARDEDADLPASLREKVTTGVFSAIPRSAVWFPNPSPSSGAGDELGTPDSKWLSAEAAEETTTRLVMQEVESGFVKRFDGDLNAAPRRAGTTG